MGSLKELLQMYFYESINGYYFKYSPDYETILIRLRFNKCEVFDTVTETHEIKSIEETIDYIKSIIIAYKDIIIAYLENFSCIGSINSINVTIPSFNTIGTTPPFKGTPGFKSNC